MAAKPYELGIVMAGAISGGAYMAGSLDFLIEALDAWSAAKRDTPDKVPNHDVLLRAMSGASAGGMCTAIMAVALAKRFSAVHSGSDPARQSNPLYRAWVEEIDITKLLQTADLTDKKPLRSLLDTTILDRIVTGVLDQPGENSPRPWVDSKVNVRLTVGNLRGMRHDIPFQGGGHVMSQHADYRGFLVVYDDDKPGRSTAVPEEEIVLAMPPSSRVPAWQALGETALASGAFPIALRARELKHDHFDAEIGRREYTEIGAPCAELDCYKVKLRPLTPEESEPYHFLCVDGGVFNNEPIELCRTILSGGPLVRNERDGGRADRGILMIDPFVDTTPPSTEDTRLTADTPLASILGPLLNAMISNNRFKPGELFVAGDQSYSRFLVAPTGGRGADVGAKHPLAAGGLGGFLAFFDRSLRDYDFHLGRRNMQRFLTQHFVLPIENDLFAGWRDNPDMVAQWKAGDEPRGAPGVHLPIVPLMPSVRAEINPPPWPSGKINLEPIIDAIGKRGDVVSGAFVAGLPNTGSLRRVALGLAWSWVIRGKVKDLARQALKKAIGEQQLA